MTRDWKQLNDDLQTLLKLQSVPLAITFSKNSPAPAYGGKRPAPTPDGRTGSVPAGCVFWIKAAERTFSTTAEDHANCSVGSVTHGFKSLDEVGANEDVAALLGSGWVTKDAVPRIPVVRENPGVVTYGPLAETPIDPDVVFLRLNGKQLMVLHSAVPEIRFEGKPQCHIIPIARESDQVAVSVGCMLSRVRTGMPNSEMTCAIPAAKLAEIVGRLESTSRADSAVAEYAAADAARFD